MPSLYSGGTELQKSCGHAGIAREEGFIIGELSEEGLVVNGG